MWTCPEDAGFRLELLSLEMSRLLDVIAHEIPGREDAAAVGEVSLRSLAGQVTQLARIAHEALGDAAARPGGDRRGEPGAAVAGADQRGGQRGPRRRADGRVEITVAMLAETPPRARLEVLDDGPGFGHGPPGAASLGLGVVTSLLESCGGALEVRAPERAAAHGPDRDPGPGRPGRRRPGRPDEPVST